MNDVWYTVWLWMICYLLSRYVSCSLIPFWSLKSMNIYKRLRKLLQFPSSLVVNMFERVRFCVCTCDCTRHSMHRVNSRQRSSPSTSGNFLTLEAIRSWWRQVLVVLHCYALLPRSYSKSKLQTPLNLQIFKGQMVWKSVCSVAKRCKTQKTQKTCQSLFPERFEYISGPSAETVKAFGEKRQGHASVSSEHAKRIKLCCLCSGQMWDAMSLAFCNSTGQREMHQLNHCHSRIVRYLLFVEKYGTLQSLIWRHGPPPRTRCI